MPGSKTCTWTLTKCSSPSTSGQSPMAAMSAAMVSTGLLGCSIRN